MASVSADFPATFGGAFENNSLLSSEFRTQLDAPAAVYPSLPLRASELNTILLSPSRLELLHHTFSERLSQLAEEASRQRARLSPSLGQVSALRETSPSFSSSPPTSKAVADPSTGSNYYYTIQ